MWSRFESAWLTGEVVETRWDSWLFGGAWRVFVAIDGRTRDGAPIVETYFTDRDLDGAVLDLLELLGEGPTAWADGAGTPMTCA